LKNDINCHSKKTGLEKNEKLRYG